MSTKKKITKKEIKRPDEFVTWGAKVMSYALAHLWQIGLGLLLLAGVVVGLLVWRGHQMTREEMAFTLLGKGIILYEQEGKRGESLNAFSELIERYPRTTSGKIALLYRGRGYMLQQDYDRAIADFELLLKRTSKPFLRAIAFNALANSYWAKGDYQKAVDYFQRLIDTDQEWLRPYALLQLGMCWERLGNKGKAIEAYRRAAQLTPASPWGTVVRARLSALGEKVE